MRKQVGLWVRVLGGVVAGLAGVALLVQPSSDVVRAQGAGAERPEDNRFTPVVLVSGGELDEPMVFQVLPDERVLIAERKGALKLFNPVTGRTTVVAEIPVNTKYTNAAGVQREAEEGLVGLTLDPGFADNGWIYMVYADIEATKHVLARWTFSDGALLDDSKRVLLEWTVQRYQCCHTGGGMTWDAAGNLYLTVGNNTSNSLSAQTDERPGREPWDDQRGAANTNDLRGKILRIHPEPDGTYTIPEGNLFAPGTPGTRPEIYIMGNRNPWRPFIDSATGCLYWGEVGPDAREDTAVGPMGYDEQNQACAPGNYGWPYFVADNQAFPYYDFANDRPLEPKDPARPTNTSVNNTGLEVLPPAQPAFIYYPYRPSPVFPEVGTGARSANGGPIYHRADFDDPARPYPAYYEGKWFMSDFSRGWIMVVTIDGNNDYVSMEPFLPSFQPVEIIDNKFGPNGDFYVLEYGSTWFAKSPDSRLVRIEYNGGNRPPVPVIDSDRYGGAAPLEVSLSSAGTLDYDGDAITYAWTVTGPGAPITLTGPSPTVTLEQPGAWEATLTATDAGGASATASLTLVAGNAAPSVEVVLDTSNQTFFFPGAPVAYDVRITDAEDGTAAPGRVALAIDYVPESIDPATFARVAGPVAPATRFPVGAAIMASTDCAACHNLETRSAGPSFQEISERYRDEPGALERLAAVVQDGGTGNWGTDDTTMPAHPTLTGFEARALVRYMLGAHDPDRPALSGTWDSAIPEDDLGTGALMIRAAYTDGGVGALPALTASHLVLRRSPRVSAASADETSGVITRVEERGAGPVGLLPTSGGWIGYRGLDLTGVTAIDINAVASSREMFPGGAVQVRLGAPDGELLATTDVPMAPEGRGAALPSISVDIDPVDGERDVYFVFVNAGAPPGSRLVTVTDFTFRQR
jgi:cytochrome c